MNGEYGESYKGKDWVETFTGRQFFPMRPDPRAFNLFDMAHALALKCRYNGHTTRFYSVAEHTLLMEEHARECGKGPRVRLEVLTHDAAETYFPDVARPLKQFCPELVAAEKSTGSMIRSWLGLFDDVPDEVHEYDGRIIVDERRDVMSASSNRWATDVLKPLGVHVSGLSWELAEALWIRRVAEVYEELHGLRIYWDRASDGGVIHGKLETFDRADALGGMGRTVDGRWIDGVFRIVR